MTYDVVVCWGPKIGALVPLPLSCKRCLTVRVTSTLFVLGHRSGHKHEVPKLEALQPRLLEMGEVADPVETRPHVLLYGIWYFDHSVKPCGKSKGPSTVHII